VGSGTAERRRRRRMTKHFFYIQHNARLTVSFSLYITITILFYGINLLTPIVQTLS